MIQEISSVIFEYISGLLSLKTLLRAVRDLSLADSGLIPATIKTSSFSDALTRTSPSGEAIRLFPMNLRDCPSFLFSSPILFAVIAYTLFSRHLTGMAAGQ